MIFRKSITAKFLAALFAILLIGQAIGAVIQIFYTRASLLDSLEVRIKREGSIAAGVSVAPLMNFDYTVLDTYLEEIMKDDDITSVHILGREGKIVNERAKAADSENSSLATFYTRSLSSRTAIVSSGTKIGEVLIDYSTKSINNALFENIVTISLYQLILLFSVGVIMMVLFNRNIKRPVSEINRAVEKITLGDLSTHVPDLGENEIGSISKGIAFLAERLSLTVSRLNSTAVNVSMAIKQVDVTYKNVIAGSQRQGNAVKEIMKSIHHANKAQSEISDGAERLASLSTENVSSLIELKATAEEIASNNQRLFKATEDSYSVVAQMTHTAKAISKNSGEALSAVEDTSASVEEIGASIREVEEHARESSKMAGRVNEITSDVGMLSIVNAVEGMDNISVEVKRSSEIVQRLGARSSDIEKVLSVIKDVTEQTNLLSLNAAILAAQAGEYGKSFSVVADEIRGLSERTASSTREIGGIVKTIQRDIKDAVSSIESARNKVDDGNGLVIKVGDALKEILTASEHSTEMTKAIERATEEQSLGLRQITAAIEDIRKMMHSVAKSTREQDNALSYLLDGVGDVREVADLSKRGTEEQAIGTRGISKNLEMANEGITRISEAVGNQKRMNDSTIQAMEQISNIGSATVKDMEEVSYSLTTLFEEIEVLKKEMEVFKVK
ncbi:MAG: HAMP domain-containing methyl-accepting chemotaxis protein [Nitrospiraceae bacterium]|nr:HAMP domain-containing methyl-accepting chemotaxis protein [Nitrospiraceae bacterium]